MRRSRSALQPSSNFLTANLSMPRSRAFFLASLITCLLAIASPLLAQTPALVTQPVDNSIRTILPGNVHPLARAQYDQGEAPPDLALHRMLLVLKRSDQQETTLRRLIENQQYKKSPSYHQWLTPEQFGAQFGPANSDIAAVTNWLQQSGFQIAQVSNGRTVIEFSGTAGQVKQAFGTAIHKYVVKGESYWANASNPSIPTALAPVIAGIDSLHNFPRKAHTIPIGTYSVKDRQLTSPLPNYTFPGNCPTGAAGDCYAVTPFDFATIYDLLPLWNATPAIIGAGQTIAVVGDSDINPADATAFWTLFGFGQTGLPPLPAPPTVITNGPDPGFNGDETEGDVDTQWAGSVAPGATVDFVNAAGTETSDGVDLAALFVVDSNLAPVLSESFGSCELSTGTDDFYSAVWEQAAAQGMSVMVSTGDNGSAACDDPDSENVAVNGLAVNAIASTPFNVAVGGTDFNQNGIWSTYWSSTNNSTTQESALGKIPETTWNDSCTNGLLALLTGGSTNPEINCNNPNFAGFLDIEGGSGGPSAFYVGFKPAFQHGDGVQSDNTRDLPDVSLFASNGFLSSFYLICQSDQVGGTCNLSNLLGAGGTSFSSPAFAGIMALVNQKQMGERQGNPNFVLYELPTIAGGNSLRDVPSGSTNSVPCAAGSPNCTNISGDNNGVLTNPNNSSMLGWTTATGYDLATGLGSVDAANLVNNWNTAENAFTPTNTILTLNSGNPVNVTHGSMVPVTVTVSPSPGSATNNQSEDVALYVSSVTSGPPLNQGIDFNSLTHGTVTWNTTVLPGGTYTVKAHYEGDTTFGGSYSSPSASITVNPEASTVYMGTPPGLVVGQNPTTFADIYGNTVIYGTGAFYEYLLRADVYNSLGNQCSTEAFVNGNTLQEIACPTGHITFNGDTNPVPYSATLNLNSEGYTEDQSIQLAGGAHTLVANYSGDNSYQPSTTTASVTVTKADSLISNVSAPATAGVGAQFTVTATVNTSLTTNTSFGLAPTGTVSFFYNTTQLMGTVQLTPTNGNFNTGVPAALAASLATSIPTAGTYNITATYSGDGNYAAVTTSNSVQIAVIPPGFTLSAAPSTLSVAQGSMGTSTITVNPTGGFTGSVTLAASGLPSGVTAAFGTNPTTGTSVLTLAASSSATAGTATVTIMGTSSTLSAMTTIALTVAQVPVVPAMLTAPSAANPGQSTSTTMMVSPGGGGTFNSNVTYACSGLPTGTTCAFSPAQINSGSSATNVTVTVNTAGPFTGSAGSAQPANVRPTNDRPKLRSQNQRLWLPLSLPLAGMVLVGLFGQRLPRRYKIVGLCLALALAGFLVACGGGSSPPPVTVAVTPSTVNTLFPNLSGAPSQTQQFSAIVTPSSTSQSVTWAVTGGTASGTIDQTGLYTAPDTLPSPNSPITITATSAAATSPGTATVNLQTPTPAGTSTVTVTVTEGSIQQTTTFSLTVN